MNQSQLLGSFGRARNEPSSVVIAPDQTYAYRWRDFNKSTVIVNSFSLKIQLKYLFVFKGNKHRLLDDLTFDFRFFL